MSLSENEIAHWQTWVGKTETSTQNIDAAVLERYAASLGETLNLEGNLPSLAHWAFFISAAQPDKLGVDGHPLRGGFMPPITLPRRMFAASDISIKSQLKINQPATKTSTIASVTHKSGKSGELVLVEVDHKIKQDGKTCIEERQTIVYRDIGAPIPKVEEKPKSLPEGAALWAPGPVDLFRFSAVTFNSHRIHYDLPYTMQEEGYPGLVVHGPFTAAKLFGYAQAKFGTLKRFAFRAQAPLFSPQPIILRQGSAENQIIAERCDGAESMVATIEI